MLETETGFNSYQPGLGFRVPGVNQRGRWGPGRTKRSFLLGKDNQAACTRTRASSDRQHSVAQCQAVCALCAERNSPVPRAFGGRPRCAAAAGAPRSGSTPTRTPGARTQAGRWIAVEATAGVEAETATVEIALPWTAAATDPPCTSAVTDGAAAETAEIVPQWTAAASAIGVAVQAASVAASVEIAPQWAATAEIVPQWIVEATRCKMEPPGARPTT
jgi:hypothetical protein